MKAQRLQAELGSRAVLKKGDGVGEGAERQHWQDEKGLRGQEKGSNMSLMQR